MPTPSAEKRRRRRRNRSYLKHTFFPPPPPNSSSSLPTTMRLTFALFLIAEECAEVLVVGWKDEKSHSPTRLCNIAAAITDVGCHDLKCARVASLLFVSVVFFFFLLVGRSDGFVGSNSGHAQSASPKKASAAARVQWHLQLVRGQKQRLLVSDLFRRYRRGVHDLVRTHILL